MMKQMLFKFMSMMNYLMSMMNKLMSMMNKLMSMLNMYIHMLYIASKYSKDKIFTLNENESRECLRQSTTTVAESQQESGLDT